MYLIQVKTLCFGHRSPGLSDACWLQKPSLVSSLRGRHRARGGRGVDKMGSQLRWAFPGFLGKAGVEGAEVDDPSLPSVPQRRMWG